MCKISISPANLQSISPKILRSEWHPFFSATLFPESHDKNIIVENRTHRGRCRRLAVTGKTQCRLQTQLNLDPRSSFSIRRTMRVKEQFNFLCLYFSCFRQAGKLNEHRVINFPHFHASRNKRNISYLVIIPPRFSRYLKTAVFRMTFRSITTDCDDKHKIYARRKIHCYH